MSARLCTAEGCAKPHDSHGYCGMHRFRLLNHGSLELPPRATLMERLWQRIERADNGCWLWTGPTTTGGYANFACFHNGESKPHRVHRLVYELLVEPIPEGLQIDHLCHSSATGCRGVCRHRLCVNPAHLEPVTPAENVRRAAALITHCPQGHPYDEANTVVRKDGARSCHACDLVRQRKSNAKRLPLNTEWKRRKVQAERVAAGLLPLPVVCCGVGRNGPCRRRTVSPSGLCTYHDGREEVAA